MNEDCFRHMSNCQKDMELCRKAIIVNINRFNNECGNNTAKYKLQMQQLKDILEREKKNLRNYYKVKIEHIIKEYKKTPLEIELEEKLFEIQKDWEKEEINLQTQIENYLTKIENSEFKKDLLHHDYINQVNFYESKKNSAEIEKKWEVKMQNIEEEIRKTKLTKDNIIQMRIFREKERIKIEKEKLLEKKESEILKNENPNEKTNENENFENNNGFKNFIFSKNYLYLLKSFFF